MADCCSRCSSAGSGAGESMTFSSCVCLISWTNGNKTLFFVICTKLWALQLTMPKSPYPVGLLAIVVFMSLPYFSNLMQSSLHLVILDTHISSIQSPILEIFSAMNSALHFLHIYRSDFYLKKKILPSNFEKILWSNKFLKVPLCRNYFLWKSRWHFFLLRPQALNLYTTFPFLHFGIL
jgi:hypothetical protein